MNYPFNQCSMSSLAVLICIVLTGGPDTANGYSPDLFTSQLDSTVGFSIPQKNQGDRLGYHVSTIGDMNGDGLGEVILTTQGDEHYIIFGRAGAPFPYPSGSPSFPATFNLNELNGINGFYLTGASSLTASDAGDINGDGLSDIIVGNPLATPPHAGFAAGQAYIVFGRRTAPFPYPSGSPAFPSHLNLHSLSGAYGFTMDGRGDSENLGASVSRAGDVNNDGTDDFVVGAPGTDVGGLQSVGRVFVVFGNVDGFPTNFDLLSLNGKNGFVVRGKAHHDALGASVAGPGDVNGDGMDDVLVEAPNADPDGLSNVGQIYAIYGKSKPLYPAGAPAFPVIFDLAALNGTHGFVINGTTAVPINGDAHSRSWISNTYGDINNDGINDIVTRRFVLFGKQNRVVFSLNSLNGLNGFALPLDSLSAAHIGDHNGDGFGDILVGGVTSFGEFPPHQQYHSAIVIHGHSNNSWLPYDFSSLEDGLRIKASFNQSLFGRSVSGAADINGDGKADLVVGDNGDGSGYGAAYVVFGN